MFSRRKSLDRRRHYTREFIESLVTRLTEAGFDRVTVVLPHNYESVDPRNSEVGFADYLQRERNYAAVILKATATSRQELMKILFINSNARAVFADDTFPMAESEPPGVFFQSPDPARAYAVFEYFYDVLSAPSIGKFVVLSITSMASLLLILFEILTVAAGNAGFLKQRYGITPWLDLGLTLTGLFVFYKFTALPTGLWIKPRRDTRLLYLANMAIKGELKDNPLVQLIVTIIGGLIVAFLAKLLGLI